MVSRITIGAYFLGWTVMILLAASMKLSGQCTLCNQEECGKVSVTYSPNGSNVFCEGSTVTLTNKSTTRDFEVFYIDWGDGWKDTVRDYNAITHVYNFPSTFKRCDNFSTSRNFQVCYVGEKRCGNKKSCHSASTDVRVFLKPEAKLGAVSESCIGKEVSFAQTGCHGTQYKWEFGDGTTSTAEKPKHTYQTTGNYVVKLTTSNECGEAAGNVGMRVLTQSFAAFDLLTPVVCTGKSPLIVNKSRNANQFIWKIGGIQVSDKFTPTFPAAVSGTFPITLITSQDNACSDTTSRQTNLTIYPTPKADFDFRTGFLGSTLGEVQFINKSNLANRYFWDLGDGTMDNRTTSPLHEYERNGPKNVMLIAYADYPNGFFCSDTLRKACTPEWITAFHAPNAMAPEAEPEGVRHFRPAGTGISTFIIQVYSPWGERVWFSDKLEKGTPAESWNGRKNNIGDILPQGAYFWQASVTFENGQKEIFTGSVTILR